MSCLFISSTSHLLQSPVLTSLVFVFFVDKIGCVVVAATGRHWRN
jgi:hypothetical protein